MNTRVRLFFLAGFLAIMSAWKAGLLLILCIRLNENTTSSAVTGLPLENTAPSRSLKV